MTYEKVSFFDFATNLTGAITLLSGLVLGAAMIVAQSI